VRRRRARAAAFAALVGLLAASAAAESPAAAPPADAVPAGPSVEERLAEIARRVQAVAIYPPIARVRGLSGETLVTFEVGPAGAPERLRTSRSSGHLSLDRAAERAVLEAAPLPRVIGEVSVPVRFQLVADAP